MIGTLLFPHLFWHMRNTRTHILFQHTPSYSASTKECREGKEREREREGEGAGERERGREGE